MVSASRSKRGASYELLRRMDDSRFQVNISNSLLMEYEEKLKAEIKRQGIHGVQRVDPFLDYLAAAANRWSIPMSLPVDGINIEDQFVFDLAIASEAPIIITYNLKHFRGARLYGVIPMWPGDFLKMLEKMT
jgi:predicted nucleic acid-binding protein